jgi:hypothetical protein
MLIWKASCTVALAALLLGQKPALAETTLRIGMTASDIPTATGLPYNGAAADERIPAAKPEKRPAALMSSSTWSNGRCC